MAFTPIDPIPVAMQSMAQAVFDAYYDAHMRQLPTYTDQLNILGGQVEANRVASASSATASSASAAASASSAADAASSALAASAGANATKWVSGTTYADGVVVWSPASPGRFSYRRIGAGAGTTDPSLDPTNWALQLYALGLGGATITGNVSLVSASAAAIKLAPTTHGLYAQLPVATTCIKAALQFVFDNTTGECYYGIKDGAGTVLGWVAPGKTAVLGLTDNTTTAGVWTMTEISKIGITASYDVPTWLSDSVVPTRVAIDTNRTLLLVRVLLDGHYAIVYDASSRSWGAPVLVRAAGGATSYASAVLSATNQVMVASAVGTTLQLVTLTLSGTSVTPNTPVSATLTSVIGDLGELNQVGASWVFPYVLTGGGTAYARAVLLTGTAPTIGNEVALAGRLPMPLVFASGSVARIVSVVTSALYCEPFTVSGVMLTAGASANTAASSTTTNFRAFMNGNGNIVAVYIDNTSQRGAIFKLTGTTEAVTAVALSAANTDVYVELDYAEISASKTVYMTTTPSGAYAGIITDTAGTISATTLSLPNYAIGFNSGVTALGVSGTVARFAGAAGANGMLQIRLECAGTTPVLLASQISTTVAGSRQARGRKGERAWGQLSAGVTSYLLSSSGNAPTACHLPNSLRTIPALDTRLGFGAPGAANETWVVVGSPLGTSIKRIEAAA